MPGPEQLGFPWAPRGLGGSSGSPLRPNSTEGKFLSNLGPGQEATIWKAGYPHAGHTDAILYRRFPDGRIYPIDKVHLPK
jgi:hypothetical protein